MYVETEIVKSFNALADILVSYFKIDRQSTVLPMYKTGANGSNEIITKVDKEIEAICDAHLFSSFSGIPVFSEERYRQSMSLPDKGWVFVLDPIDGTFEFANGSSDWSISIAAVHNLQPRVGLLLMPRTGLRFMARVGKGAFRNGQNLTNACSAGVKQIGVSPRQQQEAVFQTRIRKSCLHPIPIPTLTVKIISMLLGYISAAVYFPQEGKSANVWDYAAAVLLVTETGGKMTSLDGTSMPFKGQSIIHRGGWLATDSSCNHNELLKKIHIDSMSGAENI
ncbi:MAG: inositol monophosphatase family protein [Deltaproteobacteria bacterium]|nr:inositol monophosphatase family protein [Deltaproteobacteria bacterium]